jgi:glycine/D-amino acid oxidase-like deaminating enzyme
LATARDAEVTIVGGGTIGAAVLYHLAEAGYRDLQLIEAGQLAGATSGQAAGLVGQVRTSADRTKLAMASVELFGRFQRESPWPIDWRQTGSIRIATTEARVAEFERMAGVADSAGLEVELLDHAGLARRFPILEGAEVLAALWCPTDGYLQPNSLTTAYAQAAREMGATVVTGTKVLDVVVRAGAVAGLETDHGSLSTETVVNAAGPWAWQVAQMVGLDLPIVPVRHEYFISEPMAGWHAELPVLRLPDSRLYVRAELSSILCGGWEAEALSLDPRRGPGGVDVRPSPDWAILSSFADALEPFVPGVTTVGIRETFRGWPTFTPDGRFVVGPVPGLRGFVMAAGCNAHGVSGSAGLAQHLVESLGPSPSPYVRSLSPGRFMDGGWTWADACTRARARYEDYYTVTAADGSSATPSPTGRSAQS